MLIKSIILFTIVGIIINCLYINGFLSFGNKKAIYFISKNSLSEKYCSAKFSACTGEVKRAITFKDNRTYTFTLNCNIESGELKAVIQNKNRRDLIILTPENPVETLDITEGRYFVKLEFYKAYGNYTLTWE